MFSRNSPLKRKHSEFHDPDYPQQEQQLEDDDDDGSPGCSIQFANKKIKSEDEFKTKCPTKNDNYFDKVRQVIDREFQREIVMKKQQLEEIDTRLEKAKQLLERLRYGIVSAYYKKQEIPLTAADAALLKGNYTLFDRDDKGPQMPIHPSVKKLIGKRPKDLSEVIRSCPKRTAAQNAVQTIRAKSQAQKREERKLKQIIKEQGIVIDHSKPNANECDVNTLLNAAAQNSLKSLNCPTSSVIKQEKVFKVPCDKPSGKSLNAARLNNKIKHLIVVGNTSKYIGNEVERDIKPQAQALTHKWLVYVQPKDTKQPVERFIKKVRFHLHRSYRPNDVVDIESPPFQVSRRGWGEFPIRVQLFFHPEFHQKPVQLIHNIVLDQTLSGIQTLGAETLLEIWLRDVKSTSPVCKEIEDVRPELKDVENPEYQTKSKPNIITRTEELVDDNLLDFLNKIEASPCSISADIEKIQPTVLVNDPLDVKIKTPSPMKYKELTPIQQKTPTKILNLEERLKSPVKSLAHPLKPINVGISATQPSTITTQEKTALVNNATNSIMTSVNLKPPNSPAEVKLINAVTTVASHNTEIPPLKPPLIPPLTHTITPKLALPITTQKSSVILSKDGKILMPSATIASAVRKTILPILNSTTPNISATTANVLQFPMANKTQVVSKPLASSSPPAALAATSAPKQILQKKLVQLVDSTGKIKYMQMLVVASSTSTNIQNTNKSSVAPRVITMAPSLVKNNTATNTTQITNTVTTPVLRTSNGVTLMPAMTTKPNIFKIVPESMQTKPQIVTLNITTTGTTITSATTTTSSQQQNMKTTVGQTAKPSTTPPRSAVSTKPINTALPPLPNKLQKSSISNAIIPTKNLVFQKEGKVYIIDPQQMKYKQQQKKQVSLLKPQISLLKQQQQKQIDVQATAGTSQVSFTKAPPIHFGLKQQRINSINAQQLMQMKRMLFEKQFLRQEFTNIRSAVEFLLRRLKLVVPKDSLVADFPFVSYTLQEFCSLTAFKQRACEWLRAKNISRILRSHKDLQRLNNSSKEIFWSTKEIATFARQYAYTPPIKSLPKPGEEQQADAGNSKAFTELVKSELKQEQALHYVTLTEHYKIRNWVDKVWQSLNEYEHHAEQHQIINIDDIEQEDDNNKDKLSTANTHISHLAHSSLDTYLTTPTHLENQCQLVADICKDFSIKLAYEELDTRIYHPTTQTLLAQCLHLFIEKLLRQSIALKQSQSSATSSVNESLCTLKPQDFAKVLATNSEFDFLTNNNFGSTLPAEELAPTVKQENS